MAGNVAAVGFVGYIFVLLVLTKSGTLPNVFIPITFFYFAALFGICRMIMRSGATSPLRGLGSNSDDAATRPPTYLSPVTTSQLEEARQFGVGSVTDATTRTLDKLPVEERRN